MAKRLLLMACQFNESNRQRFDDCIMFVPGVQKVSDLTNYFWKNQNTDDGEMDSSKYILFDDTKEGIRSR